MCIRDRYYTEKIVQLPGSYQVNDRQRAVAPETPSRAAAGLPAEGFVFCCFNNNYKITPGVFDIWMRLLAQVEGSVLWLLQDNDCLLYTSNTPRQWAFCRKPCA